MSELLPCPFCGGKAKQEDYKAPVVCAVCTAACDSVEDWNRRASWWISVKDRLPEANEVVVVLCADGIRTVDAIYDNHFGNNNVTHWQPLPPAPEGDKAECSPKSDHSENDE